MPWRSRKRLGAIVDESFDRGRRVGSLEQDRLRLQIIYDSGIAEGRRQERSALVKERHDAWDLGLRAGIAEGRALERRAALNDTPTVRFPARGPVIYPAVLITAAFGGPLYESRRLLHAGAVRLGGEVITRDTELAREQVDGKVLQVGQRRVRVELA